MPLFHKHLAPGQALELRVGGAETIATLYVLRANGNRASVQLDTPLVYRMTTSGRESVDLLAGGEVRLGDCFQISDDELLAQFVVVRLGKGQLAISVDAPPKWRSQVHTMPLTPGEA